MTDAPLRRADLLLTALPAWVRALALRVDEVGAGTARLCLTPSAEALLDKGTVAAQAIYALADAAMRVAVDTVSEGRSSTAAGATASYLAAPSPDVDLIAEARVLKAGSMLVVGEVTVVPDGEERPVAHFVFTFAWTSAKPAARKLPPERRASRRRRS